MRGQATEPFRRKMLFLPRPLKIAAVCAALMLILFSRRPEMFLHPEFWAEDGWIFFVQADTQGADALLTPYGGYHHFLLRIIAAAAAGLDARWIPVAYISANLLTVANLQWLSALGLVWLLVARDPLNKRQYATDGLLAGVIGLTGIFSILLTPLFVWRAWRRKTQPSMFLASVVAITAAIQIWTLLCSADDSSSGAWPPLEAIACLVGYRLPASLFFPMSFAVQLSRAALDGLGVLFVGLLIAAAAWKGRGQNIRGLLVAVIILLIAATIFRSRSHLWAFGSLADGDRYFFLPKLLTAWLLISGWSVPGLFRGAATATCGLGLLASAVDWHYEPLADHNWPEYARRIEAGEALSHIPVNPKGRSFDHPGRHRKEPLQMRSDNT
ncbi:MAG: hypothetical protein DME32_18515 [Verrucomicrobia bacterium]|nr:MAG: hypothetical protein DME32_18515 [Verrucomicrobiota bacterium]